MIRGSQGLRRFLRPYRAPLGVATLMALVQTLFDLARPWPLKFAVDNAIGHRPLPDWLGFLDGMSAGGLALVAAAAGIALVALSGLVGYLEDFLSGAAAERVGADVRTAVFERLLALSPRFHDRNRSGDLVTRITGDVSRVQDALVAWFTTLLPEALTLVGMLVIVFAVDVVLALAALAIVPLLALLVVVNRRRMKAAQRESRKQQGRVASRATEVLRNVRAVQVFARQGDEVGRFRGEVQEAVQVALHALHLEARYSPSADMVLSLGGGLVLWLGVLRVTSGRMTLGTLLVVLTYLSSLYGPIRALARLATVLSRAAASRERIEEVLDGTELVEEHPQPVLPTPVRGAIELAGVRFGYGPDVLVLAGVDLRIEPGERVCVVGPTGVGKSTLLALLARLYDVDGGSLVIDGVDVRRWPVAALRRNIALVPQDPWILDGSIADNIAFGRPDASAEDVRRAVSTALLDELVERLPEGLDTTVGESGTMLSGGQRRRIALARAIVREAPILLLDEPTSGLDAASEAGVMEAIDRTTRGHTSIMVTHRLRLASLADRVVVLEGGRVVESGGMEELLRQDGPFARLWALQVAEGVRG